MQANIETFIGCDADFAEADLVLFGGGVIEALGDVFLGKILAEVDRYCMPSIRSTVDIKNAALGDDSVIYGDLALIEGVTS